MLQRSSHAINEEMNCSSNQLKSLYVGRSIQTQYQCAWRRNAGSEHRYGNTRGVRGSAQTMGLNKSMASDVKRTKSNGYPCAHTSIQETSYILELRVDVVNKIHDFVPTLSRVLLNVRFNGTTEDDITIIICTIPLVDNVWHLYSPCDIPFPLKTVGRNRRDQKFTSTCGAEVRHRIGHFLLHGTARPQKVHNPVNVRTPVTS